MSWKMAVDADEAASAQPLWRIFIGVTPAAPGLARLIVGFRHGEGRAWMILSGVVSVLAAALVALSWPWNSLWLLGFVLAIDLISQGAMLMLFGFSLRSMENRA